MVSYSPQGMEGEAFRRTVAFLGEADLSKTVENWVMDMKKKKRGKRSLIGTLT